MEKERRELYIEGVATHGGPESCAGVREGVGEALIGVRVGWAIEPRNQRSGVPTPYNWAEGKIGGRVSASGRRTPRGLGNLCMRGISMREKREARWLPVGVDDAPSDVDRGVGSRRRAGREGKASGREPEMNDRRESDSCVVAAKPANKAERSAAEPVEGRRLDEGNTGQQNALRTQSREGGASSALVRVRRVARKDRDARFTALLQHVDLERLRSAYRALSPRAAAGVDELTWQDYGRDLEANLRDLHARVHRGA
jgi:RNA-directed DNA polymerase